MSQLKSIRTRIQFARTYTMDLLSDIHDQDWFRMPGEFPSHVAWQVGHLAVAQYRLTLDRCRGSRPEDQEFFSAEFQTLFGRDSIPKADASLYPSTMDIRRTFNNVYQAMLNWLDPLSDSILDEPIRVAHRFCVTKRDSLEWTAAHEMIHAGQIGILRRALGASPVW